MTDYEFERMRRQGGARAFDPTARARAAEIAYSTEDIDRADQSVSGLTQQLGRRPWLSFGAALVTGYLLGSMGDSSRSRAQADYNRGYYYAAGHQPSPQTYAAFQPRYAPRTTYGPGAQVSAQAMSRASDEFGLVRQALVSALSGVVSSTIKDTFKDSFSGPTQDVLPDPGNAPARRANADLAATASTHIGTMPTASVAQPAQPGARLTSAAPQLAPHAEADETVAHYEKKGSFATGLSEKELVEGTNVPEGSFAKGLTDTETAGATQPDPASTDVIDHTQVQGSFATGLSEKQPVEGTNVREGNYASGEKSDEEVTDEDWLRRKLTQD